jgi:hypothetical protein
MQGDMDTNLAAESTAGEGSGGGYWYDNTYNFVNSYIPYRSPTEAQPETSNATAAKPAE